MTARKPKPASRLLTTSRLRFVVEVTGHSDQKYLYYHRAGRRSRLPQHEKSGAFRDAYAVRPSHPRFLATAVRQLAGFGQVTPVHIR